MCLLNIPHVESNDIPLIYVASKYLEHFPFSVGTSLAIAFTVSHCYLKILLDKRR